MSRKNDVLNREIVEFVAPTVGTAARCWRSFCRWRKTKLREAEVDGRKHKKLHTSVEWVKSPEKAQKTGISAVDSLAIHSLITCCSSSRESFWMIYTDGFLDDLQWWLLTKNQLISGWFTKNQLITHQKRFAHQDCAATVPKIQWYVWYVLVQLECWFTSWNWRYSWPWAIMVTMRGLWTQLFFGILMRIFVFSKQILAMLKDGESNWLLEKKKRLNFRLLNDLKLPRISCIQCVADLFPLTTKTFGSEGPIEKISESIKQILDVFSGSGRDAKDESWKYWCKWAVAAGRPSCLMIIRDYTTQYIWDCHNSY